jgi:hypothetical protein
MTLEVLNADSHKLGEISCNLCASSINAQPKVLGSLECEMNYFESQICNFSYPVAILENMVMNPRKKGNGRQALREFHRWASRNGATHCFLRIGVDDNDNDLASGVLWRLNFYSSEGWQKLDRPKLQGLLLDWMFRRLEPAYDTLPEFPIKFREINEFDRYHPLWRKN